MTAQDQPKRLNVGCGRNIIDGWVNLDVMSLPGIDIVADLEDCAITPLPFDDDSFDSHLNPLMQELPAKPNAKMVIARWDPTHEHILVIIRATPCR